MFTHVGKDGRDIHFKNLVLLSIKRIEGADEKEIKNEETVEEKEEEVEREDCTYTWFSEVGRGCLPWKAWFWKHQLAEPTPLPHPRDVYTPNAHLYTNFYVTVRTSSAESANLGTTQGA
jgi:hypothetical protein